MPGIVVGLDGSDGARRALDWAMQEAAVHGAPLTVVAVHEVPKSYWGGIPVVGPGDASVMNTLQQAAEEMTQRAAARLGDRGPTSVTVRARTGFVVKEILDAAQDADLVVLGSRSTSSLSRLLIGSVSHEVMQHSRCPVAIVPHNR